MNHHRYTVPEGMEKPDYIAYTEEELKAYCPNMLYNEEGWIKYGIRLQNHHGAGRIRDGLLP